MQVLLPDGTAVSAVLQIPEACRAALVLAHGAGAGMQHAFMAAVADGLAARSVATLRFNFPFMERAPAGRTHPPSPRPPFVPPSWPRARSCRACRCSRAASPSAAG
jgi:predicted alpha/beta-hydrolase family hydrolase